MPVVAPASGGLVDLVRHGETGLLTDPARPEALLAAVRALAADGATRRAIGERARASVSGRSWDMIGDQLLGHHRAVLRVRREEEAA